ncbi:PfkB domain protein [Isosphaera pallida ATCC 43644]|uniref:PfkB domain protein n=1 Tax=Isosphaera pallida (strain ATCC 43644 / DSM 9630 / IS1B) TaxID=575540 RepID=E8R421_ISOPI|nr:PfkB family carbohydrate kinase [Isosphaera pallida]ADV61608.1 PfkB domain protein [Isosphaera pallida ATCC 43644]
MILCVTLNPCLDRTLEVPPWNPGDRVRGIRTHEVVGGKGNNLARALRRLGRRCRPVTFLGGSVGSRCARLLKERDGLEGLIVQTASETREILTVRVAPEWVATRPKTPLPPPTAFFDPDPVITSEEAAELTRQVETEMARGGVEALTLSGSSPGPTTHGLYAELIALAKSRRVPVFLDTYGPPLREIWGFWPTVIQLNRDEAADHLELPRDQLDDQRVRELLARWARHGVVLGLVTDGPRPVLARVGRHEVAIDPLAVEVINPIGSGDCLLAGIVDAWLAGAEPLDALKRGVACSLVNVSVWDAGAIDPAAVASFQERLRIRHLQGSEHS